MQRYCALLHQALAPVFLRPRVGEFRKRHHRVVRHQSFDHERKMAASITVILSSCSGLPEFQPLMTIEQRIVAVMSSNHPLAKRQTVRLRDCAAYPVALPERSIGGRQLLDEVCARSKILFQIGAESNSFELLRGLVLQANLVSFQIRIGTISDERS
jgi:hypothetical protein